MVHKLKEMHRSWDRPRTGTMYRVPDDPSRILSRPRPGRLYMQPVREPVRGVTFTIMPDGKHMRVPVMNRRVVRAANQGHAGNESCRTSLKGASPWETGRGTMVTVVSGGLGVIAHK